MRLEREESTCPTEGGAIQGPSSDDRVGRGTSLKSVVKAMEMAVKVTKKRVEEEAKRVEDDVREQLRGQKCVSAAAKLLGCEEIMGELFMPRDAAMIRANLAYCEEAAALESGRPSHFSGEMPMWLVMAVKQKVQIEVDGMLEPLSMMDAMKLKEAPLWIEAVRKEVAGLVAVGCWEEVDRDSVPRGKTVAPSHFVFKIKTEEGPAGELVFVKCKARLVYGGHMSRFGSDYIETSAFVCNPKYWD